MNISTTLFLFPFYIRPEFSLHVGDLTPDVDDYALYCAFAKNYRSVRGAKGR